MQNFAVTAALFISSEVGFFFDVPDDISNGWLYAYLASAVMSIFLHSAVVINTIHYLSWMQKFRCDADIILYLLDHDWQTVFVYQVMAPLIAGIACFFLAILILVGSAVGMVWVCLPIMAVGAVLLGLSTIILSKHTGVAVFQRYQNYEGTSFFSHYALVFVFNLFGCGQSTGPKPDAQRLGKVVDIYLEMGEFARSMNAAQNPQ